MYCIYRIRNNANGKTYIGQHKYTDETNPMGKYKGSGKLLHKAYKKYGIENFETEILYSRIRDKATVDAMEIWSISKYKPEYNIAKGGTGGLGFSMSDESKQMVSLKKKEWWKEHPDFKPVGSKGKKQSAISNLKRSEAMKGRPSPMKGQIPWNKDKYWSDKTRAKISKSLQGRTAWNKGRTTSSKLWDAYIKYFTNPVLLCYINRSK